MRIYYIFVGAIVAEYYVVPTNNWGSRYRQRVGMKPSRSDKSRSVLETRN